jgi:hypothetical protein
MQQQGLTTAAPCEDRMVLTRTNILHRMANIDINNGIMPELNAQSLGDELPKSRKLLVVNQFGLNEFLLMIVL